MSSKYIQKISNVRISIPRSQLENVSLSDNQEIDLRSRKIMLTKTDLSEDSEGESSDQIFFQSSSSPVGRIIEVDTKGVADVISFETDGDTDPLNNDQEKVRPFECEICHKLFTRVEILRRHLKTHMLEKEYNCTYCGKAFDRRDVLNDHMRNHTGEKPFQCTICHKKFTRGFVLLRHMRIHTDGAFKCKFCLKTFDRKDTFRDHVRNHTGERPFKCRYCNKSFSRSFVLTKHEKGHETKVESIEEDVEFQKTDTIIDMEYEEGDVTEATEILLQKEFPQDVIEESAVEQEIIEGEDDFMISSHQLHEYCEDGETVTEEVVETEAITLATADGQIVRVISKEQYDKLLQVASRNKTYKCHTCNRTFTSAKTHQEHFNKPWENGGCISTK